MRALARGIAAALGRTPPAEGTEVVRLDDVRRRLELLLAAIHGRSIPIAAAEAPRARSLRTLIRPVPPHLRPTETLAATDGERILLPGELRADGLDEALARYRVLAMEQAERLVRGTAAYAPGAATPLERDLYLLLESAAVDAAIVRSAPGLAPALASERAAALARRPPPDALRPAEREVEAAVRGVLSADPLDLPAGLPVASTPAESLARAREMAARLSAGGRAYRGVPPVAAWGTVPVAAGPLTGHASPAATQRPPEPPLPPSGGTPQNVDPDAPPSDLPPNAVGANTGGSEDRAYEEGDGAADPDAPDADEPGEGAHGRAGEQDERKEERRSGGGKRTAETVPRPDGVPYPEWSWRAGAYVQRGATVREAPALDGDGEWAAATLRMHGATVRRLREKFERLRSRRLRLARQRDGDELDLAACIAALADARAGLPVDDRLYSRTQPARRGLAILLLVDISGSTIFEVQRGVRIIDLEKVALLLTAEALDALGDTYAVLTFSGKGPHGVRMRTVKDFSERNGEAVRRRMGALEPEGYTRLGAAVRHATALLSRADAGHRLLLLISDGKPDDEDDYEGRYGVEDSRQAVAEARRAGIFPFCLTVDKSASAYLPRIFGSAGHEILHRPSQLPFALSRLVEHLLRS